MAKTFALFLLLAGIVGSIYFLESTKPKLPKPQEVITGEDASFNILQLSGGGELTLEQRPGRSSSGMSFAEKEKKYKRAKELLLPDGYINTDKSFTIKSLVGKKIILVDFWTYSCINCERTIPYLKAWYERYKESGLEIVGVHTPEFEFEKKYENVSAAVKKFGIKYPVVQDNNYFTWREYENRYWPRKYIIDIDGFIVYDHIGEGAYEDTEKVIQNLLAERAEKLGIKNELAKDMAKPVGVVSVDASRVKSPEIYFGADRNEYLGNGEAGKKGLMQFSLPGTILGNRLYLSGSWQLGGQSALSQSAGAKIVFKYNSKDVYLVAGSKAGVKAKILKDGKALVSGERGADVGVDSMVFVKEERLYKLIQDSDYGEHTIEIQIESPGFEAFAFTFG